MLFTILIGASAMNLRRPHQKQALVTNQVSNQVEFFRVGGCTHHGNPGAGMDASKGLVNIYKDGYFHIRCMMDKMESEADWHNEQTRTHEYTVKTNVTIVRYTDRVGVEERRKMTPRVCFDFCRTVPEMLYFGLTSGRECYCTPYYHQGTGDGACTAQCEGDATKTCGNTDGMSDVYEMHTCGDSVEDAQSSVTKAQEANAYATEVHENATHMIKGIDSMYDKIDEGSIRHPLQKLASDLNVPTMALERKIEECQSLEDTLSSTLSGVSTGTTDAAEVLKFEKEERALKKCIDELKADAKSLKKFVDGLATSEVFAKAGVTKDELKKIGEALMNKFVMNPMSDEIRTQVEDKIGCALEDELGPCDKSLYHSTWSGQSSQYVGNYWTYEMDSETPIDEWVEQMTLFCMDMCAEAVEPICNQGIMSWYVWEDASWGQEYGMYCVMYNTPPESEDEVYQYIVYSSYDDQYRWGGRSFMAADVAKRYTSKDPSTVTIYDW